MSEREFAEICLKGGMKTDFTKQKRRDWNRILSVLMKTGLSDHPIITVGMICKMLNIDYKNERTRVQIVNKKILEWAQTPHPDKAGMPLVMIVPKGRGGKYYMRFIPLEIDELNLK